MREAEPQGADRARAELAAGRNALVWQRVVADTVTPVGAALLLSQPGRGDFLLESVEGGEVRGRYSLLGLAPDLLFRAHGSRAELIRHGVARDAGAPTLAALRELVAQCRIDVPAGLPPALACLVGYLGYETIGLVEELPRAPDGPLGLPDILLARPTLLLVFDNLGDELYVIAPLWADHQADPAAAIAAAGEAIEDTLAQLMGAAQPARPHSAFAEHPLPCLLYTSDAADE